jgi:hypothetical protein
MLSSAGVESVGMPVRKVSEVVVEVLRWGSVIDESGVVCAVDGEVVGESVGVVPVVWPACDVCDVGVGVFLLLLSLFVGWVWVGVASFWFPVVVSPGLPGLLLLLLLFWARTPRARKAERSRARFSESGDDPIVVGAGRGGEEEEEVVVVRKGAWERTV